MMIIFNCILDSRGIKKITNNRGLGGYLTNGFRKEDEEERTYQIAYVAINIGTNKQVLFAFLDVMDMIRGTYDGTE